MDVGQHEKHKAKKDPENSHGHRVKKQEVATAAAAGAAVFALHEKMDAKRNNQES
jgi:hypothetical protein